MITKWWVVWHNQRYMCPMTLLLCNKVFRWLHLFITMWESQRLLWHYRRSKAVVLTNHSTGTRTYFLSIRKSCKALFVIKLAIEIKWIFGNTMHFAKHSQAIVFEYVFVFCFFVFFLFCCLYFSIILTLSLSFAPVFFFKCSFFTPI